MYNILVLMATYNGEKYLQEQLNSIYAQEGVNVSILVRDDGSTDGTLNILEKNKTDHKLEWYIGSHLNVKFGFYDLMIRAVNYDVDYFAFCDQDDVWDSNKLLAAVSSFNKVDCKIPCLYYCGQRLVDEKLTLLDEHSLNEKRNDFARFMLNDAAGCTEVFNRTLLEKIVIYKPEYMLMHDAWLVKVCLAIGGKIIVDTETHMSYRQHGNNVVGLRRDWKSKLKRVKQYIQEQDVESQMKELKNGYGEMLNPEYEKIITDAMNYKHSIKSRKRLLNARKFCFGDHGVWLTYCLKILLNKL